MEGLGAILPLEPEEPSYWAAVDTEGFVKWSDVNHWRLVRLSQTNPISAVVTPKLSDDSPPALKGERDSIFVKPVAPNIRDSRYRANQF